MKPYKFVSWDVPALEVVKTAVVPLALEKAENGYSAPFKALYKTGVLSLEHLRNPVYKISGWAFPFGHLCRRYWVKTRYSGIIEVYAPNKSCIYAVLGRYHVVECLEVENNEKD